MSDINLQFNLEQYEKLRREENPILCVYCKFFELKFARVLQGKKGFCEACISEHLVIKGREEKESVCYGLKLKIKQIIKWVSR